MTSAREAELLAELKARDGRLDRLEKENALLRQKIDLLVRQLFGAKSERLDPAQLLLLLQGLDEPPPKAPEPVVGSPVHQPPLSPPPPRRRNHGARRSLHLRVSAGPGCPSICR